MGLLTYDSSVLEFDDRVLAHLQVVIVQKFRSRERFLMSWLDPLSEGDGRSALWFTPATPVHFTFSSPKAPEIDRKWLERLQAAANSGPGLIVCDEAGKLLRAMHQQRPRRLH